MSGTNFLDLPPLPDAERGNASHLLEVARVGGQLWIKVALAAPTGVNQAYCADGTPYDARVTGSILVTAEQLKRIEQAMAEARRSIGA